MGRTGKKFKNMKQSENLAVRATVDLVQNEALNLLKKNGYPASYIAGAEFAFRLIKKSFNRDDIVAIYDDYVKMADEALEEV